MADITATRGWLGLGVQLILSGSHFAFLTRAATAQPSLVRGYEKK